MRRRVPAVCSMLLFLSVCAMPALAGPGPDENNAFQFRFGGFLPEGGGEFWSENESAFSQEGSDFNDFAFGFSYISGIANFLEIGFNADFYQGDDFAAYREFVDEDGFSIFHDTELRMVPLTVDVRVLPGGRHRLRAQGRRVLKPVFYVGAGIGMTFWEYREFGDFIDFDDPLQPIFFGDFEDRDVAFETHVLGGVELPLHRGLNFLLEGRYSWADDELDGDFAGLGKIDLGGTSIFGGLSWQF